MKKYLTFIALIIIIQGCSSVKPNFDFNKVLWTSDWSPNNDLIAIGGNWNEMQIVSADNLKTLRTYEIANTITKIKWNKSGDLIAVTSQISKEPSILINAKTDEIVKLDKISKDGARGLGWNYDDSILGVGDNEGNLTLFNNKGEYIRKIDLGQKVITGISWHPSKNILVAVGSQISIYNLDNDKLKTIKPRKNEVLMLCVEWHKSGEFFVTGDYGDFDKNYPPLLQFWTQRGEKIKDIKESKAEYRNLRWSSDGKTLATASDKIRLWNTEGKLLKSRALKSLLWGIDWNADNSKLVVTSEDGKITFLNNKLKVIRSSEK
ncbi:MAG: WD40 repeat domain-containing protein [Flavobacteriaceae bacterium]